MRFFVFHVAFYSIESNLNQLFFRFVGKFAIRMLVKHFMRMLVKQLMRTESRLWSGGAREGSHAHMRMERCTSTNTLYKSASRIGGGVK